MSDFDVFQVWSAEEIWSAARDRDRSPRKRRELPEAFRSHWHRAANEALMQVAEQPGNGFIEEPWWRKTMGTPMCQVVDGINGTVRYCNPF
jgi:hypothetical protein